jgi:hypothetical protein
VLSNKGMKLTSLVAAPGWQAEVPPRAPHGEAEGRTGSQLIRGVGPTKGGGVPRMGRASMVAILIDVIAVCLTPPCLPAAETRAEDVTFDVSPISQAVALGSPISLTFRLRNGGRRDVLVNRRFLLNHVVRLEVTTPSGRKAEWCGRLVDVLVSRGDYAILKPAGQVARTIRVSCDAGRTPGYSFDAPGEYVVRARYELAVPKDALSTIGSGAAPVMGPLEADPIRIAVRGPE